MRKPTIAGIVVIIVVIGLLAYPYPIEENAKEIPKETVPVSTIKEKPIEQSMEKQ